jgi:hypothetical protein
MNTITKLFDFSFNEVLELTIKTESNNYITTSLKQYSDLARKAFEALKRDELRFNNKTGKILDKTGVIGYYTNQNDFKPHDHFVDVLIWEFKPYINNYISQRLNNE